MGKMLFLLNYYDDMLKILNFSGAPVSNEGYNTAFKKS